MNPNLTGARALMAGAVVLALLSAGGCRWFKHKSDYAQSRESRPLEVPPDLDLPNTASATTLPPVSGGGIAAPSKFGASGAGFVVTGTSGEVYSRLAAVLAGIDGVVIAGRAEALRSYDVTYQGQSFLIQVQDSAGGSRIMALSADGRILESGPAGQLLTLLKGKL